MTKRVIGGAAALVLAAGACAETRTYEVEIINTWSTTTHPGAFPAEAHFSHFGGGVHHAGVTFWEVGTLATPGVIRMAERGSVTDLVAEVVEAVNAGTALAPIAQTHWFCPGETTDSRCGAKVFEIEVTPDYPLVTLASMLGPSPDWFVGVSGLTMREGDGWVQEMIVELHPYDGGTRANNDTFALFGPLSDPQEPVSVITEESGQAITPASLGQMIFRLVTPPCAADFDGDETIGSSDLAALLALWGQPGETDLNGDGTTDSSDLAVVLAGWGACG